MQDKELLQQHPLFKKLSGQIVWYMFEERDVPPEDIDAFFTHLESCRVETLDVMRRLLRPSSDTGEVYLRVEVVQGKEAPPPCSRCKVMDGIVLSASHPKLMEYMPPYSVGCRARARIIDGERAQAILERQGDSLPEPPEHQLHCPTEWIFSHKWDEED